MDISRKLIFGGMLCAAMIWSPVWASSDLAKTTQETAQAKAKSHAQETASQERSHIIDEAIDALRKTNLALKALAQGKSEKAIDYLSLAIGKLETAIALNPGLSLAPVDVQIITVDNYGDVKAVEKAVANARRLLDDGKVQAARGLLQDMASEIVTHVTSLPLATYPDAIRSSIPLINNGNTKEAKHILEAALSTLVVVDHVTPLPVLRAQVMLAEASKLAQKGNRSQQENEHLSDLLHKSKEQVELARVLGYGDKDAYKDFNDRIEQLEKVTSGGQSGGMSLFNELNLKIDHFLRNLYMKTGGASIIH